jgi:hypothetical protein
MRTPGKNTCILPLSGFQTSNVSVRVTSAKKLGTTDFDQTLEKIRYYDLGPTFDPTHRKKIVGS